MMFYPMVYAPAQTGSTLMFSPSAKGVMDQMPQGEVHDRLRSLQEASNALAEERDYLRSLRRKYHLSLREKEKKPGGDLAI